MEKLVVDANGTVAGRLASLVAKELLKGKSVDIVNAEGALVSGNRVYVENQTKQKFDRGDSYHGPFYPKAPNMILKRIIRGMLPYKQPRGREAFKRLHVHISVPKPLEGKAVRLPQAEENLKCSVTKIGDLSLKIGAKKRW